MAIPDRVIRIRISLLMRRVRRRTHRLRRLLLHRHKLIIQIEKEEEDYNKISTTTIIIIIIMATLVRARTYNITQTTNGKAWKSCLFKKTLQLICSPPKRLKRFAKLRRILWLMELTGKTIARVRRILILSRIATLKILLVVLRLLKIERLRISRKHTRTRQERNSMRVDVTMRTRTRR